MNVPAILNNLGPQISACPLPKGTRIIVGMSGGVDSAVSALLLKQAGYHVEAMFMKNWDDDDGTEYCTAATDLLDADAVCHRLGIELHTVSFASAYREQVFDSFLENYRAGRTPNPDVLCNREIKFAWFHEHAKNLGADAIATGHYAGLGADENGPLLLRAADENKDQSYFLQAVSPSQLRDAVFPLAGLDKEQVRAIARAHDLPVSAKKDSTGICFIGERRFREFLSRYIEASPGPIKTTEGRTIGQHQGIAYYTIGQREGLGIGGGISDAPLARGSGLMHPQSRHNENAPWFVSEKCPHDSSLTAVQGSNHPALFHKQLVVGTPNWFRTPSPGTSYQARIRHRQPLQGCKVQPRADGNWLVQFETPQRAIAPGQYTAIYDGQICMGGGVILSRAL